MSDIAIRVEDLGKQYRIGSRQEGYKTLRESLIDALQSPVRGLRTLIGGGNRRPPRDQEDTIWALKDISFEVKQGEVVGVIGRNGAGKSTLLKILSRITEPTTGRVEIRGRVGSLLEVGTGFHPELTGRENIFLNGAILGMHKAEIAAKFDEIVDFAEVEKFIDTPVKRYSSGMYLRLAFAVAAHLEPEILVVDEVLAVGDSQFQKKCLGKMSNAAACGRTVLFVSHNMAAIEGLCSRGILLKEGQIVCYESVKTTIQRYLEDVVPEAIQAVPLAERKHDRSGNGRIRLIGYRLEDESGRPLPAITSGMTFDIILEYQCLEGNTSSEADVGISLTTLTGQELAVFYSSYGGQTFSGLAPHGEFRCRIRRVPLGPNRYVVGARVLMGGVEADWPRGGIGFLDVEAGDYYGTGAGVYHPAIPLLLDGSWSARPVEERIPCAE